MRKFLFATTLFAFVSLAVAAVAQQSEPNPTATDQKPAQSAVMKRPASGKALIYVYRYKQFTGSALEPSVFCDDVQLARMDNGRYFVAAVDPGRHTVRSNDKQAGVEFDAKIGQKYYMRVEIATGFLKGHGRITMVTPEQAEYEVRKLKPLDENRIVSKDIVLNPPPEMPAVEKAGKKEKAEAK